MSIVATRSPVASHAMAPIIAMPWDCAYVDPSADIADHLSSALTIKTAFVACALSLDHSAFSS